MSKKRGHELAKQPKEQGIELSNQELVDRRHQLGFEVKSHSSSLDDDQAQAAFEKIAGEKKPKAPAPRPAGPGFVVRKKSTIPVPPVVAAPVVAPAPVEPPPPVEAEEQAPEVEEAQAPGSEPVVPAISAAPAEGAPVPEPAAPAPAPAEGAPAPAAAAVAAPAAAAAT